MGRARPRRRRRGRARVDRARRRLPGQSRPAPLGAVLGLPARARRQARPSDTTERRAARRQRVAAVRGKRLGDRLCLARALPHEERGRAPHTAHQGNQAPRWPRGASRVGQGRRRARHDRRSRAQRPLARLPAGHRSLAGADGRRAACRRRASRLDRRGRRAAGRGPRRDPRCALPGRLRDGGAEDRGRRPHRGTRAGGARGIDGRARPRPWKRRPRARVDDPHLRGRRGTDPPLGGGRDRLGLRPTRGGGRVARQGGAAPERDRRAARAVSRSHGSPAAMSELPLAAAVSGLGVVDPARAVIAATDEGFTRGRAAFETLRVYSGRPFRLEEHLARLAGSADRLGLPEPDPGVLRELVHAALEAAGVGDVGLRIYWTPGAPGAVPTAIVLVSPIPAWIEDARARGQRLVSLVFPGRSAPWLLPGTKSVSYATHVAAEAEARRRGADDAVLVDDDGVVLEGTVTNIWWREGTTLLTPSLELGILAGETRAALLELAPSAGYSTEEGVYPVTRLAGADEIFTSSSVREVVPVVVLDDAPIDRGPAADELQASLRRLAAAT